MHIISLFCVPCMFLIIIAYALFKKVKIYDAFIEGAKEGLNTVISIFPPVLAILFAINMFNKSGAMDILSCIVKPFTDFIGLPYQMVPFALLRPVSGSGSLALATNLFKEFGTDSFIGRAVSTLMGSTETTFYTLSVYFGATMVKNMRHSLKCALAADFIGIILSVWITRFVFNC
ncbi:MAG: spore maturation protein [Ruminococcaceae bacterium]|nr:spore maturation protein [Oscillospiraceae bacterium]